MAITYEVVSPSHAVLGLDVVRHFFGCLRIFVKYDVVIHLAVKKQGDTSSSITTSIQKMFSRNLTDMQNQTDTFHKNSQTGATNFEGTIVAMRNDQGNQTSFPQIMMLLIRRIDDRF